MLKITVTSDNKISHIEEVPWKVVYVDMKLQDHPVLQEDGTFIPFAETKESQERIKTLSSIKNPTIEEFLELRSLNKTVDSITENDLKPYIVEEIIEEKA